MDNKQDTGLVKVLCYLGIFVLALFIVLPPFFRFLFGEEKTTEEPKVEYSMLICKKTKDFVEYKIEHTIDSRYKNGEIINSTFTYEIDLIDLALEQEIIPDEYSSFSKINNASYNRNANVYTVKFNYDDFDYNSELLTVHTKNINEQNSFYSSSGYKCTIN